MTSSIYTLRPAPTVTTTQRPTLAATEAGGASPYAGLMAVIPEAIEVDHEEGEEIFDGIARRKLGISGEAFIAKWDAGEYDTDPEDIRAQEVAMLLPLVRATSIDAR